MITAWIMTKKHGRHHGMIMVMIRHAHAMIMPRSWHGCHILPTRDIVVKQASLVGKHLKKQYAKELYDFLY